MRAAIVGRYTLGKRYLHPFDLFVKRELSCSAYVRYVHDFALFADDKDLLWEWKAAVKTRLAALRLMIHDSRVQVVPTGERRSLLGFVVFPMHRRLKARKVQHAMRRLAQRYAAYCEGDISLAEFEANVQGWTTHLRFGDSWAPRRRVLSHSS